MKIKARVGCLAASLALLVGCGADADPDDLLSQLDGDVRCHDDQRTTSADDNPGMAVCLTDLGSVVVNTEVPDDPAMSFAVRLDEGWTIAWHERDGWAASSEHPQLIREVADQLDAVVIDQATFRARFLD